ncbi:hypothetical protein ACA910_000545 [Epithemia clementina (nom. ined.)]
MTQPPANTSSSEESKIVPDTSSSIINNNYVNDNSSKGSGKVDPITALQDGIDGLSLAMFEALRGLRDAVAPESGNLAGNNNNNNNNNNSNNSEDNDKSNNINNNSEGKNGANAQHPDLEDLWQLYRQGDDGAVSFLQNAIVEFKISRFPNGSVMPQTRDQVASILSKMEESRDTELVLKLAKTVLDKSRWIDTQVEKHIPGMHRTMAMQHERIQQMLQENAAIVQELQTAYDVALQKRNACRLFVQNNTCRALDIEENTSNAVLLATKNVLAEEERANKDKASSSSSSSEQHNDTMDVTT